MTEEIMRHADAGAPEIIRRFDDGSIPASVTAEHAPALSREQVDQLVDDVVARIEQRVVDELERRGRRQMPGIL